MIRPSILIAAGGAFALSALAWAAGEDEVPPSPQAAQHPEAEQAIRLIEIPKGLKIDLWAKEPMLKNPVSMSFDHRGRIWVVETFRYRDGVGDNRSRVDWLSDAFKKGASPERMAGIADELLDRELAARTLEDRSTFIDTYMNRAAMATKQERIVVLEDSDGDGRADRSKIFAGGFNDPLDGIAAGVLPMRNGDVFFTNIPHLWRLRDANGDGVADARTFLHRGFGVRYAYTGHDLHGLRVGPDGRLYFSIGDRGAHIETEGRVLAVPDTGAVFRCNLDGSGLEVFASGLRNPQDLVFDVHGNLFTGDNDSDVEDPRWVYLVEGGDSGWRIGYQYFPKTRGPWLIEDVWRNGADQAASSLPPIAILANGPSGAAYYPGTGLPRGNDGRFFLADFKGQETRSGVLSFTLKARGASFELIGPSRWAWGVLATDVDFGPDGGLYILDWLQGWNMPGKGRVYRIHDPALASDLPTQSTGRLLREGMGGRSNGELAQLIGHPDMRIRQEAQFQLVANRATGELIAIANSPKKDLERLHAIWGLGQLMRADAAAALVAANARKAATTPPPSTPPPPPYVVPGTAPIPPAPRSPATEKLTALLGDANTEVRAQAAKVLGDARVGGAFSGLSGLLADANPRVQFFAAQAIGKLGNPEAVPALIALLARNGGGDRYVRHAAATGLLGAGDFGALMAASRDGRPAVRMGILLALRRQGRAEVARFLSDSDPAIVREAARAINDVPIDRGEGALGALPIKDRTDAPTLMRVISANFRLGTLASARRLAGLGASAKTPAGVRAEAIAALGDWPVASGRDRVTGMWHPVVAAGRDARAAATALAPAIGALLRTGPPAVQLAAARSARKLKLAGAASHLAAVVAKRSNDEALRAEALAALGAIKAPVLTGLLPGLQRDPQTQVRVEAFRLAVERNPAGATPLLMRAMASGTTVPEKQEALASLKVLAAEAADKLLARWMDDLLAGKIPAEVTLDLLEAAGRRKAPALEQKLAVYEARRPQDDLGRFREALVGGDKDKGRKIFEKAEYGCQRCHRMGGTDGGDVGPDLKGVGKEHTREQILAAVVVPNREMAEGFESVIVTMKNGAIHGGVLRKETADTIEIRSPESGPMVLVKRDIKLRERGASAMPDGFGDIISRRDLRDLIEYLARP